MTYFRLPKKAVLKAMVASVDGGPKSFAKMVNVLMLMVRMGYPEGINHGQGFRGGYTLDQFWRVIFCLQVMKFDVTLSRALKSSANGWLPAPKDAALALSGIVHSIPGYEIGLSFYWIGDPARLEEFDGEAELRRSSDVQVVGPRIRTVGLEQTDQLQAIIRETLGLGSAWVVEIREVVERVLAALRDPELEIDQNQLSEALRDWARSPAETLRTVVKGRKVK